MDSGDFLNLSQFRIYPLVSRGTYATWSNKWILDAGITMGVSSGFVPADDQQLELVRIEKGAGDVVFVFSWDTIEFEFTCPDNSAPGLTIVGSGNGLAELGFGFVQIGDISDIPNGVTSGTGAYLMPCRVQSLNNHFVNSVNIANYKNTGLEISCEDCEITSATIAPANAPTTLATGIDGTMYFEGGQFASVSVDPTTSTVIFGASTSPEFGDSLPCDAQDLVEIEGDELTPCRSAIYSLNGVLPSQTTGLFKLLGTAGVAIASHPTLAHALQIKITPRLLWGPVPTTDCV